MPATAPEVILIESRKNRITGRITGPSWLPEDLQLIQGDLNPLSGDTGHQQKLSAAIEVTSPEGRKLLRRLLEVSDVFVSSLSAPTLPKWGPTYEELSKVNPGIIYLSVPGFGNTPGPYYESVTYGPALAAMAGLEGITGWPDRPASGIGPISLPDWTGAHHLAIAVVSALLHRQKTGVGQYIDMSQFEVAISCFRLHHPPVRGQQRGGRPQRQPEPRCRAPWRVPVPWPRAVGRHRR